MSIYPSLDPLIPRDLKYDAENRLIEIANHAYTLSYVYDYLGRRVKQVVRQAGVWARETVYVCDGFNLVGEYDVSYPQGSPVWTVERSYGWGPDMLGSFSKSGGVGALQWMKDHPSQKGYYAGYDGRGNLVCMVEAATGILVSEFEYDPYGNMIRENGRVWNEGKWELVGYDPLEMPLRYQSKWHAGAGARINAHVPGQSAGGDPTDYVAHEFELYDFGLRWYRPRHGRFINRDPIAEAGGPNLYAYVDNDPVNHLDFLGMCKTRMMDPGGCSDIGPDGETILGTNNIRRDAYTVRLEEEAYANRNSQAARVWMEESHDWRNLVGYYGTENIMDLWTGIDLATDAAIREQFFHDGNLHAASGNHFIAPITLDEAQANQRQGLLSQVGNGIKRFFGLDPEGGFLGTSLTLGEMGVAAYDGGLKPGLDYWERAIVEGDNFGAYFVAAIEGAGTGIYSTDNPNGFGAMTLGTGQLAASIGITTKGVLTESPTLVAFGLGLYGAGTTNLIGGAVYGPAFEGPLSPNTNIKDWSNWFTDWWGGGD